MSAKPRPGFTSKGRFAKGNRVGKLFGKAGEGQSRKGNGRPPVTMREIARDIGADILQDGRTAVRTAVVKALAGRAIKGDVRAAEVFGKWHDGDADANARPQRYLFTRENLDSV